MRTSAVVVATALLAAAPASASWSPPRTFAANHHGGAQLAVDGRGDALVVWTSRSPSKLRATWLPAHGAVVRSVLSRRPGLDTTVALDERGEATVAWTVKGRLYATHGRPGHWSEPQAIVRAHATGPVLAVSRQGTVLLAWTDVSGAGRTAVAWRSRGHSFGTPTRFARPAPGLIPGEGPASDVGATFDGAGRAYVWGTCDGAILAAPAGSRHLALAHLAPGRALGLSLAVTPSGRGLAAWTDSTCTSDVSAGSAPGPVRLRVLRSGRFEATRTVPSEPGGSAPFVGSTGQAFALAGDGSLITAYPESGPWATLSLDASGTLTAVTPIENARLPIAADGAGDLAVTAPYVGVTVRPRGGGDDPFDRGGEAAIGASAGVDANARGIGVVWDPDLRTGADNRVTSPATRLSVSLWHP